MYFSQGGSVSLTLISTGGAAATKDDILSNNRISPSTSSGAPPCADGGNSGAGPSSSGSSLSAAPSAPSVSLFPLGGAGVGPSQSSAIAGSSSNSIFLGKMS